MRKMNLQYFFIHKDLIEERNLDIGFDLYEQGHIIWLLAIALISFIAGGLYKRSSCKEKIRKFFAAAIISSEAVKDLILAIGGAPMIEYLPLHLCSFAMFCMLADAFCKKRRLTGQLMAYAFMPGACAALLFCNWTAYPFFSFMNIFSFVFHGWIVMYFVMLKRAGEIKISYRGLWQSIGILAIVAVPVYIFNLAAETNYLFLNQAQQDSPLVMVWNIFGERFGQAGYLAGVCLLVILVFHLLYVIYRALEKFAER